MKKLVYVILILCLVSGFTSAQEKSTSPYDMKNKKEVERTESSGNPVIKLEITERMITTAIIFSEVAILLLILFYWKKTRDERVVDNTNQYKKNIKAIRNERIVPVQNRKISSTRRSLKNKINVKSLNGLSITRLSKKLDVSKGELFLAAKIQQLQNQAR